VKNSRVSKCTIGAVLAVATILGVAAGAHGQKAAGGKQWLAAMDTDNDGTVSKQEFNAYMDAQFDKADVDHDGTLDAKELEQLRNNLSIAIKQ
jgi:Ca2+-binding EF-hand superfamily protein